jgi:hypothetical protein
MNDIQRWSIGEIGTLNGVKYTMHPFNDGGYVLYTDHVAAVAAARAEAYEEFIRRHHYATVRAEGIEQGQREERDRITKAVEALNPMGRFGRVPPALTVTDVLAAIKGDGE